MHGETLKFVSDYELHVRLSNCPHGTTRIQWTDF